MKKYVLDANVAFSWYFDESFSLKSREWHRKARHHQIQLCVPTLHFYEFASVLRKNVLSKTFDKSLAEDVWNTHINFSFDIIDPPHSAVFATAIDYQATPYDAVYISLALQLNVPLITAEHARHDWLKKMKQLAISIA